MQERVSIAGVFAPLILLARCNPTVYGKARFNNLAET
jgi:hypothetical protein